MTELNHISGAIIGASYRIATRLGPGLLESVYEKVLARDLTRSGLHVERQKWISFDFEGMWFENAFKVDLLVEHAVLVEIKSQKDVTARDHKQVLTYLRLLDLRLGLLINFGAATLKDGIKRIAN
jgi:iron complex transport system substrate-binding protein